MAQGPSYPKGKFKVKFVSKEESVTLNVRPEKGGI